MDLNAAQRWIVAGIDAYAARGGGLGLLGVDCNFHPTCSVYAREAVVRHGAVAGLLLAWRRIRRCTDPDCVVRHEDPVPQGLCESPPQILPASLPASLRASPKARQPRRDQAKHSR